MYGTSSRSPPLEIKVKSRSCILCSIYNASMSHTKYLTFLKAQANYPIISRNRYYSQSTVLLDSMVRNRNHVQTHLLPF